MVNKGVAIRCYGRSTYLIPRNIEFGILTRKQFLRLPAKSRRQVKGPCLNSSLLELRILEVSQAVRHRLYSCFSFACCKVCMNLNDLGEILHEVFGLGPEQRNGCFEVLLIFALGIMNTGSSIGLE